MAALTLRPATRADAFALARLHVATWRAAYRELLPDAYLAGLDVVDRTARWERNLESGEAATVVAESSGAVKGFVSYGPCRDGGAGPDSGEIWAIYVAPESWGQGVGRILCHHALAALAVEGRRRVSLWMFADNERAARFYTELGFVAEPGSRQRFELDGFELDEIRFVHDGKA